MKNTLGENINTLNLKTTKKIGDMPQNISMMLLFSNNKLANSQKKLPINSFLQN